MQKKTVHTLSQVLGWYQLVLGLVTLSFLLYSSFINYRINLFFYFYLLIPTGLLCFSIYSGYKCLTDLHFGLRLSFINQLLQFAGFTLFGFQYYFSAAPALLIGVDVTEGVELIYQIKPFKLSLGKAEPFTKVIMVNLIPIVIYFLVDRINKLVHNNVPG